MRKMPGIIFGFVFCFSIFAQVDVNFDKKMEEYKANLEKFKTELKSPDSFIRQDACMALGVAGDTSALPSIRELLEDPDENVRAAAISSLSLLQDKPSITNIIILGLKDKFGVVRASAASSLAILGEKKCIPALRVLMQSDKDSMVKAAAAGSLHNLGDMLVQENLITPDQLEKAVARQKTSIEKRLGDVLVEMNFITQDDLLKFLGKQQDFTSISSSIGKKKINIQLTIILTLQGAAILILLAGFLFIRSYLFGGLDFLNDEDVALYMGLTVMVIVSLFIFSSTSAYVIFKINRQKKKAHQRM